MGFGDESETPGSAGDPGAVGSNSGGSQRQSEAITMLTLEQLRRFGPRDIRMALELRWPALKRGGGVVPWGGPHEARSSEGGNCPSDQRSGLSTQQGNSP